jgi:hypothetical protein
VSEPRRALLIRKDGFIQVLPAPDNLKVMRVGRPTERRLASDYSVRVHPNETALYVDTFVAVAEVGPYIVMEEQ